MNKILKQVVFVCFIVIAVASAASAQKNAGTQDKRSKGGNVVVNATGTVAVVIVKSAARATWATTRFAAKRVAKPLALKVAPKVAMMSLRFTGVAAKRLLPYAIKLSLL